MSRGFGPQRSSAGIPLTRLRPEAASLVVKAGGLCLVNADGNIAECGADPALIGYVSLGAGQNHGTAAIKQIEVHEIADKEEYDAIAKGVLTATMVGELFGVVKDTDNFWKIDLAETVNTRLVITDIPSTSTVGGTDQVVTCTFLTANIQFP